MCNIHTVSLWNCTRKIIIIIIKKKSFKVKKYKLEMKNKPNETASIGSKAIATKKVWIKAVLRLSLWWNGEATSCLVLWCAFIFLCAFTHPDLLNIHPGNVCLPSLPLAVFNKRSGRFLSLYSKSSPSSAPHYFSIPSPSFATYSLSGLLSCLIFLYFPHPLPSCSLTFLRLFFSTSTLSTRNCNGAEVIKWSEKRKISACTCTISLCYPTCLSFVTFL